MTYLYRRDRHRFIETCKLHRVDGPAIERVGDKYILHFIDKTCTDMSTDYILCLKNNNALELDPPFDGFRRWYNNGVFETHQVGQARVDAYHARQLLPLVGHLPIQSTHSDLFRQNPLVGLVRNYI
jgi:hypothetical protein